jgi:hypothetical protein
MAKINPTGEPKSQYENFFHMSVQHEKPSLFSTEISGKERGLYLWKGAPEFWQFGFPELPGLKSGNHT